MIRAALILCLATSAACTKSAEHQFDLLIDSAHPYDAKLSADEARKRTAANLLFRIVHLAPGSRLEANGDRIAVWMPPMKPEQLDLAQRVLTRSGRLELRSVDEGTTWMTTLASAVQRDEAAVRARVRVGEDHWTHRGGEAHSDFYLQGPSPKAIQEVVAALPAGATPPQDHELLFQEVSHPEEPPYWRSHWVRRTAELDGDAITDAQVTSDPQSGRLQVSVSLDPAGAKRFEELTARSVGRKLAIVLEGVVSSAPVVHEKIAGGRLVIDAGGLDTDQIERETRDLVAVLRSGGLSAPVRLAK